MDEIRSSHPSRVRGLKHCIIYLLYGMNIVAPLAGAWIETCCHQRS